ncbi:hypothetical protein [Amycolatopsis sp. NPDC051903]|uniref:hypothetical protein n=1 Tax=Amycolatopsis sp. NPDC051903 TaxID=3363936 RepID=UPI0037A1ED50
MIDLPGWESQSIWGWDDPCGSFFAQLWRNGNREDTPDLWLSGVNTRYADTSCILVEIVQRTGEDPAAVTAALGLADRKPRLRPDAEAMALLHKAVPKEKTPLARGAIHALGWAQGLVPTTPVSRNDWSGPRPTADQIHAEHQLATGRLHLPGGGDACLSGIDAALWWLLRHNDDTWFL